MARREGKGPEERLLERARSPEDAAALIRFDQALALPLIVAALMPLMFTPTSDRTVLAAVVNIVAWLVFLLDFVVHFRRLDGFLSTWIGRFDLTVVVLTAPWFLIFGPQDSKFVLLIRLARLARLVIAGGSARRLFERLGRVAVVALSVVLIGAAAAYGAEHSVNPGFKTYGDASWWAVVTLATVGYGDIVPKTTGGRIVGVMIMVTGIGLLGVLAGSLASFFRLSGNEATEPTTSRSQPEIATELVALRTEVARLADEVAQLRGAANDT